MDGQTGTGGLDDLGIGVDVVKVAVGVKHVNDGQVQALGRRQDDLGIAAGVDDRPLEGLLATHQVAVGLQQADGQGFDQDDNALQVFWADGETLLARTGKSRLARQLVEIVARLYAGKVNGTKVVSLNAKDTA